jgi:predicted PurR-regulated permease PerM
MFSGNAVTTVAFFSAAFAIFYLARGAFFILFLSVLFADLLEPAVTFLERHSLRIVGIAAGPSHRCI